MINDGRVKADDDILVFLYDETVDEDKKSICGIYTISIIDNKIIYSSFFFR